MKKHILTAMVLIALLTLTRPPLASGQEGASSYHLRRDGISAIGGEMVAGDQGRYRQRGSAGLPAAVTAGEGETLTVSVGFWWRVVADDHTGSDPARVYLPVIIKAPGQ